MKKMILMPVDVDGHLQRGLIYYTKGREIGPSTSTGMRIIFFIGHHRGALFFIAGSSCRSRQKLKS